MADPRLDILFGLWQEAPFARLPPDAPEELQEFLVDVEDPTRVYTIHCAARRHNFQILVDKFNYQLRTGCGDKQCTTATCFTCRKRLAGKSPIRRYSPSSARTLGVYLASQDNPDRSLCPSLRLSKPKDRQESLITHLSFSQTRKSKDVASGQLQDKPISSQSSSDQPSTEAPGSQNHNPPLLYEAEHFKNQGPGVTEVQVSAGSPMGNNVDYRSFSANLFNTASFRMLEWLTPKGISEIRGALSLLIPQDKCKTENARKVRLDEGSSTSKTDPKLGTNDRTVASQEPSIMDAENQKQHEFANVGARETSRVTRTAEMVADDFIRAKTLTNTRRRTSLDPVSSSPGDDTKVPDAKSLGRTNSLPKDRTLHLKPSAQKVARPVAEITSRPSFFENVTPPGAYEAARSKQTPSQRRKVSEDGVFSPKQQPQRQMSIDMGETPGVKLEPKDTTMAFALPVPQSLSRLSPSIIDFICNVFEEDGTQELDEWQPGHHEDVLRYNGTASRLRRTTCPRDLRSRRRWKLFNEQALFGVLSNPQALIATFSTDSGRLLDSPSLWYYMARLMRIVPSLVLHSLWISALALFVPPNAASNSKPMGQEASGIHHHSLSHVEAEYLTSICLHALAALAPISSVPQERMIRMSKIRSRGYTLSSYPFDGDLPTWMREKYDDAFSNDLALRLARRICCSMAAKPNFSHSTLNTPRAAEGPSCRNTVLNTLFDQISYNSLDKPPHLHVEGIDRLQHVGNMRVLLLDWAKTVVMHEWNRQPIITAGTVLDGALNLLCSIHNESRFLSDSLCRMDYIPDRLDFVEMPLEWLEFESDDMRLHILDYPMLFNEEARVNFFRSINFSRMSRAHEEASSLKSRMDAIVDPGSLVTNPHHKLVLQDLLNTASEKFLILSVSRDTILRDAFDQLFRREHRELLRPLKVHLGEDTGELGFDSGGVQQEFFRLILAECLNPDYGAFVTDDRTHMTWFMPGSVVELWRYELIGLLVSIAVYNGLTLPVTFPLALYRKLFGWPVDKLGHISDGWPDLVNGLLSLREWNEADGLVEDVFARTYEFSVEAFGTHVTRVMKKSGSTWPQTEAQRSVDNVGINGQDEAPDVTGFNRAEYISDYIRYLTDVSVRPQFEAFQKGFNSCLSLKSLMLLSPQLLQSIVEGEQDIDIAELHRYTKYVEYSPNDQNIKDFWSVVKRYDLPMKRKLLEFVTASNRVPVGGVRNLQFVIQRNGGDEQDARLPTAYTCYGILLLPEYSSKDILREKLEMALEHAQGFGFL